MRQRRVKRDLYGPSYITQAVNEAEAVDLRVRSIRTVRITSPVQTEQALCVLGLYAYLVSQLGSLSLLKPT